MQNILFIELLGGIGDLLIALSAIQAIGRSYPSAKLTVLTFAPGGELLRPNPLIDQVIVIDRNQSQSIRLILETLLAHQQFNLIVSDTNHGEIEAVIQASDATKVVTNLWQSPPSDQRVGERMTQILLAEGVIQPKAIAAPQLYLTSAEQHKAQQRLRHTSRPLVVLIPDAGMTIKRWLITNFISVGRELQQQYGATILVTVGVEGELAQEIVQAIGGTACLWPRTSLRELAAILGLADLVIAPDTGPARIAATLNTPTITLFGPSWAERYGQASPHINLQGYPDCPERNITNFTLQACWYSGVCPFGDSPICLDAISVEAVLLAAAPFLTKNQTAFNQISTVPPGLLPPPPASSIRTSITPLTSEQDYASQDELRQQWAALRNILVIRLDNIGDVLMLSPALRAIKETLPQARLTLMASPSGAQAATLLPWVDEVLVVQSLWQDLGKLEFNPEREGELVKTVRDRQFDGALIFTSFSQTPHAVGYLCYLAGIPLRIGESKEWGGAILTTELKSAPDEIHQVERNLRIVESVGFPVSDRHLCLSIPTSAQHQAMSLLQQRGLEPGDAYILLNPWTSCLSRNYSLERFAIAARELADITGYSVVVTGVTKDLPQSLPLLEILGNCAINLIGMTNLAELAALINYAKLMLSNNTATMHIADATNTPSVILFAGTEYESQWRPRYTISQLLRQPTLCSPCYTFVCPYHLECLDIAPKRVTEAGLFILQQLQE